jgi:hypothetical protein
MVGCSGECGASGTGMFECVTDSGLEPNVAFDGKPISPTGFNAHFGCGSTESVPSDDSVKTGVCLKQPPVTSGHLALSLAFDDRECLSYRCDKPGGATTGTCMDHYYCPSGPVATR